MEYSPRKPWQEISESEVIYDVGSLYARFQKFSDPRKAQGKRCNLTTMLVIIFLGKLRGKDRPMEIADWAKNQAEELSE